MATTRILFIGGTGVISRAVVERCLDLGHEVTVLNRGSTTLRPVPDHVESLTADVRDEDAVDAALGTREFDVVADFLSFTPDHVGGWVDRFAGRTGQYLFVSSASAYQTPPERLPVTESTPLRNPFWQYSRDKIACEDLLVEAYRDRDFPATIVRPSHTYDRTMLPTIGHWTDIARMRAGKPVIVHGDGMSLWTITHARDVAVGIAGILGHHAAVGEAFHATGDEAPTWNQIYGWLADAAGVEPRLVHVASETIAAEHPATGPGLLGDKSHSMVFDNEKLRALVPGFGNTIRYQEGAREVIEFHDAHPELQRVDEELDRVFDRLAERAGSAAPA